MEYLYYPCGGCHPKGLIVANSYKIKQTITIITIRISTNITFMPVPILLLIKQEKKKHKCKESEALLRIYFWYLLMNLKDNYLLKKLLK